MKVIRPWLALAIFVLVPNVASTESAYKYAGMYEEEPLTVQKDLFIPATPPRRWIQRKVMAEIEAELEGESVEGEGQRDPAESH